MLKALHELVVRANRRGECGTTAGRQAGSRLAPPHAHMGKDSCVPFYVFERVSDLANAVPEWRPQLENCTSADDFSSAHALLSPYAAIPINLYSPEFTLKPV